MNAVSSVGVPTVIMSGDQQLANYLAKAGPRWNVLPAAPTISELWDKVEAGEFPSDAEVVIFVDGSGDHDELVSSAVEFAKYSRVFVVAHPDRIPTLESAINAGLAGLTDKFTVVNYMPVTNSQEALSVLRNNTSDIVQWDTPTPSPTPTPTPTAPVAPAPPVVAAPPAAPVSDIPVVTPPVVEPVQPVPNPAPTPPHITPPTVVQEPVVTPATPTAVTEPAPAMVAPPVVPAPPAAAPVVPDAAPAAPSFEMPSVSPAATQQSSHYSAEVHETISQQKDAVNAKSDDAMVIAVMSSKGGAGKSTVALSLATMVAQGTAAAKKPLRVALVDLDTRDGQVCSLIGQYMPTALNIRVKPVWDEKTVLGNMIHSKNLGIDALLAPVRPRNADDVGPAFYSEIINVLRRTHDLVILDCSVQYLDPLLGVAFAQADEILFVTTLAATSVQGMARALNEMFADESEGGLGIDRHKVGVVANQVINNVGMGKDKLLQAALGAPLVGAIPAEPDEVIINTNNVSMEKIVRHPRLGPAYHKLATTCLPDWTIEPVASTHVVQIPDAKTLR